MAPHSSTLAWKIPWMEKPGRLQPMGSLRVGHDWATSLSFFTFMHWRRKWQPTPVFLPGESQGRGSLVGCRLWSRAELDTTEVTLQQQQTYLQTIMLEVKSSAYEFSGSIIQFIAPCILYSFLFFPFPPSFLSSPFLFFFGWFVVGGGDIGRRLRERYLDFCYFGNIRICELYNSMFIFQVWSSEIKAHECVSYSPFHGINSKKRVSI